MNNEQRTFSFGAEKEKRKNEKMKKQMKKLNQKILLIFI